jgi:hypothetical protein
MKRKSRSDGKPPQIDRLESRSYLSAASFSGPTFVTDLNSITGIATADLANKGHQDLVVAGVAAGTSNSEVGIYLSKNGAFATPTIIPVNGVTGGVAIGDFLGNGHQDVAVVDATSETLSVLLNDGAGNFSQGVGAGIGGVGGDTGLVSADFNQDGKQDLAVVEPNDSSVGVFFSVDDNTGSNVDTIGRFVSESTISVPSASKVVVGDFNHDGFPDLAILSSANPNSVYIALNDGHGNFSTTTSYAVGSGIQITDLSVADFNGDGLPDLAVIGTEGSSGAAAVLLNQGGGVFSATPSFTTSSLASGPLLSAVGTFTGSGHQDIASISSSGALDILAGDGTGNFAPVQHVFTTELTSPQTQVVAGDFVGNGRPDLAFISSTSGGFGVLLNTTGGAIVTPPPTNTTLSPLTPVLSGALPSVSVVAGQKIKPFHQKIVLTNTGSTTINGKVTVSLSLSSTTTAVTGAAPVASLTIKRLILKAHRTRAILLTVRSLPATASGPLFLVAVVTDPQSLQNSSASAKTLTAVAPTVDLSGSFTHLPASLFAGKVNTLAFNVINSGTIPAVGQLEYKVFLSKSGVIDSNSILLADVTRGRGAIRPGVPLRLRLSKVIKQLPAGGYFAIVQLDPKNVFHDIKLTNNTFVSAAPAIPAS